MYGFLFVNGLSHGSPNKRRLEKNNESGESNPLGKGRKNPPEFPSPAALSPGSWAARCTGWVAPLIRGPHSSDHLRSWQALLLMRGCNQGDELALS
jgi:hypothetical protein